MKRRNLILYITLLLIISIITVNCENEEGTVTKPIFETEPESTDSLDVYLKENFRDPYGSVIIYKFVDRYIDVDRFATPPRKDVVQPIAELIKKAWIAPYNVASDQGEAFLQRYFPAELVILGSPLFNNDGTITLGIADSGVRVTLTDANAFTPDNAAWILRTFRTLHHEFAHIVDQNFNFDDEAFYEISNSDYTSPGSWTTLIIGSEFSQATINNAITRGMVTAYGTSSVGEDFAELVAYIISTSPEVFTATYLTPEDCTGQGQDCNDRNRGRERIQQKYDIIVNYMKDDVGIDILSLRDTFLESIN